VLNALCGLKHAQTDRCESRLSKIPQQSWAIRRKNSALFCNLGSSVGDNPALALTRRFQMFDAP
jgi:hypothetical protein